MSTDSTAPAAPAADTRALDKSVQSARHLVRRCWALTLLSATLCSPANGESLRLYDGIFTSSCPGSATSAEPDFDLPLVPGGGPACEPGDRTAGPSAELSVPSNATPAEISGLPGFGDAPPIDIVAGSVKPLATHTIHDSQEGLLVLPVANSRPDAAPPHSGAEVQDIGRTIDAWARAWSERNPDAYLRHYSADFSNGEPGFSMAQWRQQRRERLLKPDWIQVKAQDLRIDVAASGRARVLFRQDYRSGAVSESRQKILVLRREGDAWRIIAERSE